MAAESHREGQVGYALLRLMLGVNICMHGITRLAGGNSAFAYQLESQFAKTILPHPLLAAFAFSLSWAEAIIGCFIAIGLLTPLALTAGFLLVILLTFGVSLLQNWQVAGLQLIYGFAYAALLGLLRYNHYSLDSVLRLRRRQERAS